MATILNFGIAGVSSDVLLGKGGVRIKSSGGALQVRNTADTAFANLEVAQLISSGSLQIPAGTASSPSLSFTGDTDTGLYQPSSGTVGISTNGVAAVTIVDPGDTTSSTLIVNSTRAITLPAGANADRPSTPVAGMIRYNTGTNIIEFYNGTVWSPVASGSLNVFETISLTGNASGGPLVADSQTDTLTLDGGAGIQLVGNASTDTVTFEFTRTGLPAKTTPVLADTVAIFDSASANDPSYASFTNIFNSMDVVYGVTSNGLLVRTADDTYVSRSITVAGAGPNAGLSVTNGNGVSGNPELGLDITGLTSSTTLVNADEFVVYDTTNSANRKITAQNVRNYMLSIVDPLVRRDAGVSIDDSIDIASALPTPASGQVYVTRIIINVTTAASGGVGGTITDGTNTLVAASEWDWNTTGVYVIDLPLSVTSTGGQLEFVFTTAPTTAGVATVTAEYKIV